MFSAMSLFIGLSLFSSNNPIKVAVIDTGLDTSDPRFSNYLCQDEAVDFTGEGIGDLIGHGTHVTGTIIKNAGLSPYCLMILKYWKTDNNYDSRRRLLYAFRWAIAHGASIINYSGGGEQYDQEEYDIMKSHPSVMFLVAAGNNGVDLDKHKEDADSFYPAEYPLGNVFAVGCVHKGVRCSFSNWGSTVRVWEDGLNIMSTMPTGNGTMSGTSMSTAVATGKAIQAATQLH